MLTWRWGHNHPIGSGSVRWGKLGNRIGKFYRLRHVQGTTETRPPHSWRAMENALVHDHWRPTLSVYVDYSTQRPTSDVFAVAAAVLVRRAVDAASGPFPADLTTTASVRTGGLSTTGHRWADPSRTPTDRRARFAGRRPKWPATKGWWAQRKRSPTWDCYRDCCFRYQWSRCSRWLPSCCWWTRHLLCVARNMGRRRKNETFKRYTKSCWEGDTRAETRTIKEIRGCWENKRRTRIKRFFECETKQKWSVQV